MEFWHRISTHLVSNTGTYLAVAVGVGGLAFLLGVGLWLRVRSLVRPLSRVRAASNDAEQILSAVVRTVESAESDVDSLARKIDAHLEDSRTHIRHLGLVRYNAFEDIAGQQSYSLCLLDHDKNGVILTYLTSKTSTRSYAVTVERGEPSRRLSDEEEAAMDQALSRRVAVHSG